MRALGPVLLAFLCSCSSRIAFPPMESAPDGAMPFVYPIGPWKGKFEQRWILERGGTEAVFTMYLKVTPPHKMHMVAVGDLGTTLCECTLTEVKQESPLFPGELGQQILRDIRPLFQPYPPDAYRVVIAGGERGLYREEGDERVLWRASGILTTYAKITVKRWREATAALIEISGKYNATVETRNKR